MTYDMTDFLKPCVEIYRELAGKVGATLKRADTPFIDENMEPSNLVAPGASGNTLHLPEAEERGELAGVAARILMKVLYAARMARFDLLRVVSFLAQRITKWT